MIVMKMMVKIGIKMHEEYIRELIYASNVGIG